jgi:hypothetical protein
MKREERVLLRACARQCRRTPGEWIKAQGYETKRRAQWRGRMIRQGTLAPFDRGDKFEVQVRTIGLTFHLYVRKVVLA